MRQAPPDGFRNFLTPVASACACAYGLPMESRERRRSHVLGLGLDGADGHVRVTKGDHFTIVQGSEETHERMTEVCMKMEEKARRKGRTLGDLSTRELRDLAADAGG